MLPKSVSNRNNTWFVGMMVLAIIVAARLSSPFFNMITWDVFGYYLYLPASFIYHDLFLLDSQWLDAILKQYEPTSTLYQAVRIENGNWVMKYSMGMAILFSPFFFIAHFLAEPLGYVADGFSRPYQVSLVIAGMLNAIVGVWFFIKVLRYFFKDSVASILLIIICLGTNYFQLTAFDGTLLAHNFLFTAYALLVWLTIQWHLDQKFKWAVAIGLLCGLITLIRPSEIVCVLIPIFWGIYNLNSLREKLRIAVKHLNQILLAIMFAVIVGAPQLIYWYAVSGKWLFYSYTNAGEGFEFLSPYTWPYLFSFRKGWLIYTPVMLFALIGFIPLYQRNRKIFTAIILFFLLNLWIVSSWTTWWYAGGSFSARSLVPAYVLLAIPLGYFLEWVLAQQKLVRGAFYLVFSFLICLNLFQTWQFRTGIITRESMTMDYYFASFGKLAVNEEDKSLLLVDRSVSQVEVFENHSQYLKQVLYFNEFTEYKNQSPSGDTVGVFIMNSLVPYSPGPNYSFLELTKKDHAWLVATVDVFIPSDYEGQWPFLIVSFNHKENAYKYKSSESIPFDWKKGAWNKIIIEYLTPEVRSKEDNLMVYVWHQNETTIAIDNLQLEVWEPKK